jgi:hypothetical protein
MICRRKAFECRPHPTKTIVARGKSIDRRRAWRGQLPSAFSLECCFLDCFVSLSYILPSHSCFLALLGSSQLPLPGLAWYYFAVHAVVSPSILGDTVGGPWPAAAFTAGSRSGLTRIRTKEKRLAHLRQPLPPRHRQSRLANSQGDDARPNDLQ